MPNEEHFLDRITDFNTTLNRENSLAVARIIAGRLKPSREHSRLELVHEAWIMLCEQPSRWGKPLTTVIEWGEKDLRRRIVSSLPEVMPDREDVYEARVVGEYMGFEEVDTRDEVDFLLGGMTRGTRRVVTLLSKGLPTGLTTGTESYHRKRARKFLCCA